MPIVKLKSTLPSASKWDLAKNNTMYEFISRIVSIQKLLYFAIFVIRQQRIVQQAQYIKIIS